LKVRRAREEMEMTPRFAYFYFMSGDRTVSVLWRRGICPLECRRKLNTGPGAASRWVAAGADLPVKARVQH
jgi:hypothetical protein